MSHSFVQVGDLDEILGLLELVGFQYDTQIPIGRGLSITVIKQLHYLKQKHLLTDDILRKIYDFVALDYFLFDFQLPKACQ